MPKVLIADQLSPAAVAIFKERGVEADVKTGLSKEELLKIVDQYDGIAIRSATKITAEVVKVAKNLKVVGRAGIGVDNVDIPAATAAGVIVMNTPFGNSITTAEHAISLMLALARDLPAANASTQAGKWEKNRFMGVEITGKVLGLIGAGNIGSIVADRAKGLKMRVVAYDPFLSAERAQDMGVEKVELNDLLAKADFITLHVPMTPETKNILSAEAIAKTKKGVRIINCARGGLIDEKALKEAIDSGQVAGAALDVFEVEPAKDNILFNNEKVVATPHLGASTSEAQENVALQVAEQISDYLLTGAITNALNMPSISASEAQKVRPWISLAEKLGSFAGQLTGSSLTAVEIIYEGTASQLNTRALTQAALAGLLKPMLSEVNMVNAPVVAKERGIKVSETRRDRQGVYEGYIKIVVTMGDSTRRIAGTVFSDGRPRLIQVKDINLDAEFAPHMLYVVNEDKPGFIGKFGTLLGEAKVNIANFTLGRSAPGQDAIALIEVDGQVPDSVIESLTKLPMVKMAKALAFSLAKLSLFLIWMLWGLSWLATMFWSAPTVRRVALGRQLAYRLVTLIGFLLLFEVWSPRYAAMTQLWRLSSGWQWVMDLVVVLGFAFCWWARVTLGDLWSANVTHKQGHSVIATGPYALVRHPIYTGIIVAAFASAALEGTLVAMIGAAVMTFGWYLKARLEEEFLREELGFDAYHDYAERTAMLLPFIRF